MPPSQNGACLPRASSSSWSASPPTAQYKFLPNPENHQCHEMSEWSCYVLKDETQVSLNICVNFAVQQGEKIAENEVMTTAQIK
jgi:hypothetical protein